METTKQVILNHIKKLVSVSIELDKDIERLQKQEATEALQTAQELKEELTKDLEVAVAAHSALLNL